MLPFFAEDYGNAASRTHSFGHKALAAVEHARGQIAAWIGCSPKEIAFTSGATESDNLAILGVAAAIGRPRHLVVSAIEHKAVLDPALHLERGGWRVTRIRPRTDGIVDPESIAQAIAADTALVSVMTVNNEIGTLQPIEEIAAICRTRGVPFHTDAAQAGAAVPLPPDAADLVSVSAHKMYGPKGIGAIRIRRGRPRLAVEPILFGGGHERGFRPGTLPVPLIVGFGLAADLAVAGFRDGAPARLRSLRDRLWTGLAGAIPGILLNGATERRHPGNLNFSIPGVESQALMMSIRELAMSSGSACTSATLEPSHVLREIGVDPELAHASVRIGLGRFTTEAECDYVVDRIGSAAAHLRAISPQYT
jgi:cysteine desulfurase